MKANVLIPLFEPVNSTLVSTAGLNELNLIKLKLPSKVELKGIVLGNSEMYNDRIEDNLPCKVYIFFETFNDGSLPVSRPFKCTHFWYPKCVTAWKFFGLDKTNKEKKCVLNECLVVKVVYLICTKICTIMIGIRIEL